MTHRDLQRLSDKSPRAGETAGGTSQGDKSMAVPSLQLPERIDVQVRRIAPEVLEEFGVSRVHQIAGHVDDARRELMEALKLADRSDLRDLHVEVGEIVNLIDDLRVDMAKRGGES